MAYIKSTDRKKAWALRQQAEKRPQRDRSIRNLFRIYCEGEVTEPEYFRSFPINTETKVEAIGLARSKTALVNKAIEILSEERMLPGMAHYDEDCQLWVVFDYDKENQNHEARDFNEAIRLAEANGLQVAYSNDSFELWFVLHFQKQSAALTRKEYYEILSKQWCINYEKDGKAKEFAQSIYYLLLDKQEQAIKFASALYEELKDEVPAGQNPCTTVHLLVEELNKCLKR